MQTTSDRGIGGRWQDCNGDDVTLEALTFLSGLCFTLRMHQSGVLSRRASWLPWLSLAASVFVCCSSYAVTLQVDGLFRTGQTMPVKADQRLSLVVTVATENEDFRGSIELRGLAYEHAVVRQAVRLPAPSRKRFFLATPPLYGESCTVSLLDDREKEVESYTIRVERLTEGQRLWAVMFREGEAMPRLASPAPYRDQLPAPMLAPLPLDDLPADGGALENADSIFVGDDLLPLLDGAQAEALTQYVVRGGNLVVYGGRQTTAGAGELGALLPARPLGRETLSPWAEMADFAGMAPLAMDTSLLCTRLEALGTVYLRAGELPLMASRNYGCGRVIYLAMDLSSDGFRDWPRAERFMREALDAGRDSAFVFNANRSGQVGLYPHAYLHEGGELAHGGPMMQRYLLEAFALRETGLWWMVGFVLVGYLVAVGPVNYFVLRAKKRLEWMWYTIPVIVFVVTAVVYVLGITVGSRGSGMRSLAVYRTHQDTPRARVDGLATLLSTRHRRVTVNAPRLAGSNVYRVKVHWNAPGTDIIDGSDGNLSLPMRAGLSDLVAYEGTADLGGGIGARLYYDGELSGEITNRAPVALRSVGLMVGSYYRELAGVVEPGATIEVTPSRLDLGQLTEGFPPAIPLGEELGRTPMEPLGLLLRGGMGRYYLIAVMDGEPLLEGTLAGKQSGARILVVRLDDPEFVGDAQTHVGFFASRWVRTEDVRFHPHDGVPFRLRKPISYYDEDDIKQVFLEPALRPGTFRVMRMQGNQCESARLYSWKAHAFHTLEEEQYATMVPAEYARPIDGRVISEVGEGDAPICWPEFYVMPVRDGGRSEP